MTPTLAIHLMKERGRLNKDPLVFLPQRRGFSEGGKLRGRLVSVDMKKEEGLVILLNHRDRKSGTVAFPLADIEPWKAKCIEMGFRFPGSVFDDPEVSPQISNIIENAVPSSLLSEPLDEFREEETTPPPDEEVLEEEPPKESPMPPPPPPPSAPPLQDLPPIGPLLQKSDNLEELLGAIDVRVKQLENLALYEKIYREELQQLRTRSQELMTALQTKLSRLGFGAQVPVRASRPGVLGEGRPDTIAYWARKLTTPNEITTPSYVASKILNSPEVPSSVKQAIHAGQSRTSSVGHVMRNDTAFFDALERGVYRRKDV